MAHVVMFTFPAQGNASPILNLAELLALAGLHVTFINTENFHCRLLRHSPEHFARLSTLPRLRFRTVPDGLPKDHPRPILEFLNLERSLRTSSRDAYREILLNKDGNGWPPVTCVIADANLRLAYEFPEEMGFPVFFFRTTSAASFWAYHCIPDLLKAGEIPLSVDSDMDEMVENVRGMEKILRRRDLPSFCQRARTADDPFLLFAVGTADDTRSRAVLFNTFECLEAAALSLIRSVHQTTYAVGPLHSLLQGIGGTAGDTLSGLWEQDRSSVAWLDEQPHRSVVYVSFGSVAVVSEEQLAEFRVGLVDSGYRVLWVLRSDLMGSEKQGAPVWAGELEATGKMKVVGWAPQREVLGHPAVGCFLTHSGWNSTLESFAAGVPMVCWPFFADQQINSRFVEEVWGSGVDMKDVCSSEAVTRMMRTAMEGERAERMRLAAERLADEARRSVGEGGSSRMEFLRLVEDIKGMAAKFSDDGRRCKQDIKQL
ncbi:hypothetical protein HPP92_017430 [Vanilla planifolia]|uniref:Glycosyltransferase n=1 Tax=Vanilla planifolia TaxID=51239 RepID=A0A835QI07_VANPL|nr:hypothetical protein HPP92_017430 [Vanilla planifolia]